MNKDQLIQQLTEALREAEEHLDWCNYGDPYESRCAREDKLPEKIESALKASEEYLESK